MSKKCPRCESKNIHITEYPAPTDSMATCYGCGYADLADRFPEQTVFDRITASPEVLAEEFGEMMYDRVAGDYRYYSMLTGEFYNSRAEAVAATVARLKEVEK